MNKWRSTGLTLCLQLWVQRCFCGTAKNAKSPYEYVCSIKGQSLNTYAER
jgi:hypothetical protein